MMKFKEVSGIKVSPVRLSVRTKAFPQPKLAIGSYSVDDISGINRNHKIDFDEVIELTVNITNLGVGKAEAVRVTAETSNRYISFLGESEYQLGDVSPDKSIVLNFRFVVDHRYAGNAELPISLRLEEKWGKFGIIQDLVLELNDMAKERGKLPEAIAKLSDKIIEWLISSKNVFVVVGVNNYKNRNVARLNHAVSDAKAIAQLLRKKTKFEMYEELYDDAATKSRISNVIDRLSNDASIDRIIFFFAGHGYTKGAGMGSKEDLGFFLPVDGDPDKLLETAISMSEVNTWARVLRARHVLFIFDACFSGIIGEVARSARDYNLDFLAEKEGRHVITAGTKNDKALEYSDLRHGVLTYYLLKGLDGEADNSPTDNVVTLGELKNYLENRITNYTEGKQHPQIIKLVLGDGELFFELKSE